MTSDHLNQATRGGNGLRRINRMKSVGASCLCFFAVSATAVLFSAQDASAALPGAAPSISVVKGTLSDKATLTISGQAFGNKVKAEPVYWSNLEDEVTGSGLSGWSIGDKPGSVVTAADKWSGNKSLRFAMNATNNISGWSSIIRDLGASPKWYFHFKVKLNKNDSNTQFQWKSWRISSSSNAYSWNQESTTAVMLNDWWWRTTGWFNTATITNYNNGGASTLTSTGFNASDAILLNKWQTLEQYAQMSSAPLTPDGITLLWRDGRLVLGKTNHVTNGPTSQQWRYFRIGLSTSTGIQPAGGQTDCDIYYDDIYLDNTQARVMLGDQATFAASTHREIQPATAWNDNSISFTANLGAFTGGPVYLYVVDENGKVNAEGYPLTIENKPTPNKVQNLVWVR